jgi:predicted phosphodiesterase
LTEKIVLAIADTHTLSRVGLMGPDVEGYAQNPVQKVIWSEWESMVDRVKEIGKADLIVHGGDWNDGPDRKGSGYAPVTCDIQLQCDEAVKYVSQIPVKHKNLLTVCGSNYHVGNNMSSEQYIMQRFNDMGWKTSISPDSLFKSGGVTFHLKHSMPVGKSVWMYKATNIAREMLLTMMEEKSYCKGFSEGIDVFFRAHTHQFVAVEHRHSYGCVLPCWKGRDEFIAARANEAPDLGYLIFYCDDGEWYKEKHIFRLVGDKVITRVDFDKGGK